MKFLLIALAIFSSEICSGQESGLTVHLPWRCTLIGNHDSHMSMQSSLCQRSSNKQKHHASSGDHFLIHYDVTGSDAVSDVDANANSVPDYIDSVDYYLEYAWKVAVDELGFEAPPPDNLVSGQGGDDGRIDVYVCDVDAGFYGAAWPETENPTSSGVHGYMGIDNDYSETTYATKGIAALRVTTAHNLLHLIMFASYRFTFEQAAIYEATSTWFEYWTHPDVPDYRQYVDLFLKEPELNAFSTNEVSRSVTGYAHMLFIQQLVDLYGTDIVREIWEEFRTRDSFDAIDTVLRHHGSTLQQSYCEFAHWCYYTGSRAKGFDYFYQADELPTMQPESIGVFTSTLALTGELQPLAFTLRSQIVEGAETGRIDTLDFLVTNSRSDIGAGGPQVPLEGYSIELRRRPLHGFTQVFMPEDTLYYRFTAENDAYCLEVLNGVVGSPISGVDVVTASDVSLILLPFRPNPATDVGGIRYSLPYSLPVTLTLYDAMGRQVRLIECGVVGSGEHIQEVDVSSLERGAYSYQLQAGTQVRWERMMIVR
jgi:hypothetical protein